MVPPITLRPPVPDDVEALAGLHVRCWREAYSALLPEDFFTPEVLDGRRRLWAALTGPLPAGRTVRVAELDGRLLGFAVGGVPETETPLGLQLFSLYVLSEAYGTGLGQALLDAVLPAGPAFLWVAAENPRAQAFYRKNGFATDGATEADPGFGGIRELRMTGS